MNQMDFSQMTLLVIAGGKSSRMGQDKRWLELEGKSLLERLFIKAEKQHFASVVLSAEKDMGQFHPLLETYAVRLLVDEQQNLGPMEGITLGLEQAKTEWVLAVSVDMPFFSFASLRPLLADLGRTGIQAVIPVVQGRKQPLAAFYHRSMAGLFRQSLSDGQRKLGIVIEQASHCFVPIPGQETCFFNVNTMADWRMAKGRAANLSRRVPIISVIAPVSGTGKTTFLERLIPLLEEQGIRIGVVKSDAHGFQLDVEGKDSWRFQKAGAKSVAVVSPDGWMLVQKTEERAELSEIAEKMEDVDLILTESRTHGRMPAISLWR